MNTPSVGVSCFKRERERETYVERRGNEVRKRGDEVRKGGWKCRGEERRQGRFFTDHVRCH